MSIDLVRLHYFVKIIENRSLRRAADELHIAQPALSRHIQHLEEEYGVPLLLRTARGVAPTEAGLALMRGAQRLLSEAAQLRSQVGAMAQAPAGTLRIGVLPAFGHRFLPNIVANMQAEYPAIDFVLVEGFSHSLRDMVIADELDIGIYAHLPANPDLRALPLYDEQLWLIGKRGSWKPPSAVLEPAYLAGRPLIVSRLLRPMAYKAAAPGKPLVAVEIEGATMTSELIRAEAGLYFGPPTMVWKDLQSGEFVGAPVRGHAFRREFVQRKDRPPSAAADVFKALSIKAIEEFARKRASPIATIAKTRLSN
jgi:LysR family nitrogen assimilation transcriptional regulator